MWVSRRLRAIAALCFWAARSSAACSRTGEQPASSLRRLTAAIMRLSAAPEPPACGREPAAEDGPEEAGPDASCCQRPGSGTGHRGAR